jgi:hypothetical protein
MPLGESLMDLEARFRYSQRTVGESVVMISAAMPEAGARAQLAAMDRHVRALEARLGRGTEGIIHWARGPLLGTGGSAIFGLCIRTQLGGAPADAEGLCTVDRHEVAHCVLNILKRIAALDVAGRRSAALIALADDLPGFRGIDACVVTALEHFTDRGRPGVRVRIENESPTSNQFDWRADTFVLAADDLYAAQSERAEGVGPDNKTYQMDFTYDRHEGAPVLRSIQTLVHSPDGSHWTNDLKVVKREFGPISEEEFDPDHFLDGSQMKEIRPVVNADESSQLQCWYWLTFPIGALGLFVGAALSFRTGQYCEVVESAQPTL